MNGLLKIAKEENIKIDFYPMKKLKVVSIPHSIAINPKKVQSNRELKEIVAHEIGHQKRNAFYNINSTYETKARQEERAARWAVNALLPAEDLKAAFDKGYTELWQLAEYFDLSEEFISNAVRVHKLKGRL